MNAIKTKNYIKNNRLLVILLSFLLLLTYCVNVNYLNTICIIGDEFGYWAGGAYLAGLNWGEVASFNSYYSYGYSIWLSLILRLFKDPINAYKAAIVLNGIFIVLSFNLLIFLAKRYLKGIGSKLIIIICFVSMLYAGIFFSSQTTQCESIFTLFFIVEVFFVFQYFEKPTFLRVILMWSNAIYLYTIHQRALVALIALVIIGMIYAILDHSKWGHIIVGVVVAGLLFWGSSEIKNILLSELYQSGRAVYSNNYVGQVEKIKMLFSVEGMKDFLLGILGKAFYLGVSTFGIFYFAIIQYIAIIKSQICRYRNIKKLESSFFDTTFLSLIIIGTLCISTLQLLDNKRIDTLIYGRYSEFLVPIMAISGIYYLFRHSKSVVWIYAVQMILSILVFYQLYSGNFSQLYPNNISAIGNLYYNTWDKGSFIFYISIGALFFTIIICLLTYKKQSEIIRYILLMGIGTLWIGYGYSGAKAQLYTFSSNGRNLEFSSFFKNLPSDINVYYCPFDSEEEFAYLNVDYLQYLAYDKTIYVLDYPLKDVTIDEDAFLFIPASEESKELNKYVTLQETYMFKLLCLDGGSAEEYYDKINGD